MTRPTLHLAPCRGFNDIEWPATLPARWLVASVRGAPGFEQAECLPLMADLVEGRVVWDSRDATWRPAAPEIVRPIVWRARLALVVGRGPALADIADRIAAWRTSDKAAALRQRYGKPPPDPPPALEARPLLEEPARATPDAVMALLRDCGPYAIWRRGDASHGLHAVLVGPDEPSDAEWLGPVAGSERIVHHRHVRTVPVT